MCKVKSTKNEVNPKARTGKDEETNSDVFMFSKVFGYHKLSGRRVPNSSEFPFNIQERHWQW